jgi:hypothetical protein
MRLARFALPAALLACGKSEPTRNTPAPTAPGDAAPLDAVKAEALTPNQLFGRGIAPTFVLGAAGDDRSDRNIDGQVELLRATLYPQSPRLLDTEISTGSEPWPAFPVVYGGPHVNALMATTPLPFELAAGRLAIGGKTFEGDGYVIYTAIPAAPSRPAFVLFAGTGTPGTDSINWNLALGRGDAVIMIADAFGPLVTGTWRASGDGSVEAVLGTPNDRPSWRPPTSATWSGATVSLRFLADDAGNAKVIAAAKRGVETAIGKLGATGPLELAIYVYPDAETKQRVTGFAGNGHAIAYAHALHVVALPGLESLIAHEATHVIAPQVWGVAPTAMIGEGLAVWVSGQYGGRRLTDWAPYLKGATQGATIAELLGKGFARLPEPRSYPNAGVAVKLAIEKVGLAKFREHLYGATALDWRDRAERAGTTAEALDAAMAASVGVVP